MYEGVSTLTYFILIGVGPTYKIEHMINNMINVGDSYNLICYFIKHIINYILNLILLCDQLLWK